MTPTVKEWSDGATTGGRKKRQYMGVALAAVAIFALIAAARFITPWLQPASSTPSTEASTTVSRLAGSGEPAMLVERVDGSLQTRPYLGITYIPVSPPVAARYGLEVDWGILVTAVAEGGPAFPAGVMEGDILLFLGEQALSPDVSFLDLLWHHRPGATVKLVVWREGRHFTTEAVLGTQ